MSVAVLTNSTPLPRTGPVEPDARPLLAGCTARGTRHKAVQSRPAQAPGHGSG